MKHLFMTLLTLALLLQSAIAGDSTPSQGRFAYRGFSGGMMLHAGWISRGDIGIGGTPQRLSGVPMGIGGALRVKLGDHLRVGTEGYTSSVGYGEWGSSLSIGWGGLLVDWCWQLGRLTPYVGASVGGGSVENLTLTHTPSLDTVPEEGLSYRKYGVGVVAPFAGVEYPLTERMSLTFKADWLLPLGRSEFDFPSGARCYVGFMFNH
jgi:opacity protein-like surface antigen